MKQLKFLMVAFTLLMGVSLTSCLSDDAGESMYDGIGYVRTVMGTYFIDPNGNTYYPTSSSVVEMEAQGFVTLEPTDNYGQTYKPWMYGTEMLVLPVSWKMENKEEMLKQHTLSLVYIDSDEAESGTELVFYLRHDKGTDTKTDVFAVRNKAYNIKNIMEGFKTKNGSYPTTIIVKAKTDVDGATLPENYTDYSISLNWSTQSKSN